jgi:hypothetical protein
MLIKIAVPSKLDDEPTEILLMVDSIIEFLIRSVAERIRGSTEHKPERRRASLGFITVDVVELARFIAERQGK